MTNACVARFTSIYKAAFPLPSRRKFRAVFIRIFSTCASSLNCSSTPVTYPHSFFVLNAHLAALDPPQRSEEWFALRQDRLTTSTFSTALGLWKGKRRYELWHAKVYGESAEAAKKGAMAWGALNEAAAIERYKSIMGRDVSPVGFAIHSEERFDWIGASPDGLLGCFPGGGILEVKCPFNKGKPEKMFPWSTMPFYYMPQVQGQMEVMDREWVDLYCWTSNGSTIFRVCRDRGYWQLIHSVLREFWWKNVLPAREALLLGSVEEAESFKPSSTHKLTGLVIVESLKLAREARLLCKEISGDVEFFH